jgi:hypothetical protein
MNQPAHNIDRPRRYYGKYRGTVISNQDVLQKGRLLVNVPDVLNGVGITSWAMPCLPVAGIQMGMFTLPLPQSGVWIEFEQGDPDRPIWVGGFWGNAGEVPARARLTPPLVPGIAMQTPLQNTVYVNDVPAGPTGGVVLMSASGASIAVNDSGIYIQNGKGASITMIGPTVTVNAGALVIT